MPRIKKAIGIFSNNNHLCGMHMNRQILRLAIPNIISNVSVPLLGIVDTALMGRMESEIYIGAIALGSLIFNFIYWGFAFLRMGTTGLTAQAFGAGDTVEGISLLARGLVVALGGSIILILCQLPIAWLGFSLMKGGEEVKALAESYFLIRIYAAPATISLYAITGWFLGMQNARYPMWITIVVNLANIGFNLLFIFSFGMKSDGVALGTVCAQYLGLGMAIFLFFRTYRSHLSLLDWANVMDAASLKRFFSVNGHIFIRTICLVFTFSFFTSESSGISAITLAANQILLQYFSLMAYGVDGFAFAAESLTGRFMGAQDRISLKRAIKGLFAWGTGLGALFALAYLVWGAELLYVFTDQSAIIEAALPYLPWMSLISLAGAIAFLWDGVYIGATATAPMQYTMLISTFLVFLPAHYLSFPHWQNHGLWMAMFAFMLARAIALTWISPKYIFQKPLG